MDVLTDRTGELEQKLRAVHIDTRDGCTFWRPREESIVKIKQCWYCAYSQFNREDSDAHQKGLCKFKK